ncbi:hypothetical protein Corgl_1743 [Coriobacterium glomerans PW2]|uniref:Uncharacterized protein n=1 Tax=Coriobacterium glomerans (strain ATCC 49209 / DSM 20642 / JCM 10262 / PW2) TaxID=700015 RepID=F2N990_CORGP|nr:hypothetical protein [Coriobacterium glomerans]AEB07838.1 hypothetical protein Corgl_1743 [Coriobacterium glomerans PW2]
MKDTGPNIIGPFIGLHINAKNADKVFKALGAKKPDSDADFTSPTAELERGNLNANDLAAFKKVSAPFRSADGELIEPTFNSCLQLSKKTGLNVTGLVEDQFHSIHFDASNAYEDPWAAESLDFITQALPDAEPLNLENDYDVKIVEHFSVSDMSKLFRLQWLFCYGKENRKRFLKSAPDDYDLYGDFADEYDEITEAFEENEVD